MDVAAETRRAQLIVAARTDGVVLMRTTEALAAYPERLTDRLLHWAAAAPERCFIARRGGSGEWQRLSYANTLQRVRQLAASLLGMQLTAERPVVILSGNSLEHQLLALACMYIGVPHSPVSPAYSTSSGDHAKLRQVLELLTPGLVAAFAESPRERAAFDAAIAAAVPAGTRCISELPAGSSEPSLLAAADAAHARVNGDTIVKFLLTSGSTGVPKAVITTQRMICSNLEMGLQPFAYARQQPPVLVDWLPWNHVFGGTHNVGHVLYTGGTLYIDDGRPTLGGIGTTARNLGEIAPTAYLSVPKGFEMLLPFLERDAALARQFFSRLQLMFFAGAAISQPVLDRLNVVSLRACGRVVPMLGGLGATETAPSVTFTNAHNGGAGRIGLPAPGNELKLTPAGGKLELRVRGPHITPGYWRRPELTAAAFDAEGYYCLGDAVKFVDPARPELGLQFDGRIAEDFKLSTGTWVSVGPLRASLIAALAPYVQDVVIAGLNEDYLGALLILDVQACRAHLPNGRAGAGGGNTAVQDSASLDLSALAHHPALRADILARLRKHAATHSGSSTRIARASILDTPPSLDAGEITDKGSINQRNVLAARAALVRQLYSAESGSGILQVATV
jgi:feruloyl-CoA synthase